MAWKTRFAKPGFSFSGSGSPGFVLQAQPRNGLVTRGFLLGRQCLFHIVEMNGDGGAGG